MNLFCSTNFTRINLDEVPDIEGLYIFKVSNFYYIGETVNLRRRMIEHLIIGSNIPELKAAYDKDPESIGLSLSYLPGYTKASRLDEEQIMKNRYINAVGFDRLLNKCIEREDFGIRARKPVMQFSETGELIANYPSVSAASKELRIPTSEISNSCKKLVYRGGYLFLYVEDIKPESLKNALLNAGKIREKRGRQAKEIYQFDLQGRFLEKFTSVTEAARKSSAAQSNISLAASGKIKTSMGFFWRYADQVTFTPKEYMGKEIPEILFDV